MNFLTNHINTAVRGRGNLATVAAYGLGAVVLGIFLARWIWILFASQTATLNVPVEQGSIAQTGRLFGTVVEEVKVATAENVVLPNIRVIGLFAASPGKRGFAIVRLDDNRQLGVVAGGSVMPGMLLKEVHADYVVLEQAGVQYKIKLEGKSSGGNSVGANAQSGRFGANTTSVLTPQQFQNGQAVMQAAQEARDSIQRRSGNVQR
ncbi:MAG: type II secretion system protein N [Candidatus Nitrotoga sp.]